MYTLLVVEHYKPRSLVFFCFCNVAEQAPFRETSDGGKVGTRLAECTPCSPQAGRWTPFVGFCFSANQAFMPLIFQKTAVPPATPAHKRGSFPPLEAGSAHTPHSLLQPKEALCSTAPQAAGPVH